VLQMADDREPARLQSGDPGRRQPAADRGARFPQRAVLMTGMLTRMQARLVRFARDARAVAAVEFALILPPLLLLFLGTIEGSSLITVDRRVQTVSGTIGDLVARWDPDTGTIPSNTMADYITASEAIIFPYDADPMAQTVSLVRVFANNTTRIV